MSEDLVLWECNGRVATITLNRPPMNPLSPALLDALHRALDAVQRRPEVRAVVLTGSGERAFCAGADIREQSTFRDPEEAKAFRIRGRETLERIEHYPKPVIAQIRGYCIGGGTALAWVCDLRIAAEDAVFRAGDAYLGIVPSWGMGLLRLPRLLGRGRALDLLLLGEDIDAATAHGLGLVSRVVPAAQLDEAVAAVCERLTRASPQAILATRKAVAYNLRHSFEDMARYEEVLCEEVFRHPDAEEGFSAFLDKRAPVFRDLG